MFRFAVCLTVTVFVLEAWEMPRAECASLSRELIKEITSGHEVLSRSVANVSGQVEFWRGSYQEMFDDEFDLTKLAKTSVGNFYVRQNQFRFQTRQGPPREGSQVVQDRRGNADLMIVAVQTPDSAFLYSPASTSGVGYSNLSIYKDLASPEVNNRITSMVRSPLFSLFRLGENSMLEALSKGDVRVEDLEGHSRKQNLRIVGQYRGTEGDLTEFEVDLLPAENYAISGFEMRHKIGEFATRVVCRNRSRRGPHGLIPEMVSKQIETRHLGKSVESSSFHDVYVLKPDSFDPPDPSLFTIDGFKALKRDYTLVHVAEDGTRRIGKTIVAAPESVGKSQQTWLTLVGKWSRSVKLYMLLGLASVVALGLWIFTVGQRIEQK